MISAPCNSPLGFMKNWHWADRSGRRSRDYATKTKKNQPIVLTPISAIPRSDCRFHRKGEDNFIVEETIGRRGPAKANQLYLPTIWFVTIV